MDTTGFGNMAVVGPGIWFTLHTQALAATTDELKRAFVIFVNNLCDNFRCANCKTHFRHFINTHPFQLYWTLMYKGRDIGLFKWTWELHNKVNAFLHKYQPSFDEALEFFSGSSVCTDCGHSPNSLIEHVNPVITPSTFTSAPVHHQKVIPGILDQYLGKLITPQPLTRTK